MFTKQKKLYSAEKYKNSVPLSEELRAKKRLLDEQLVDNMTSRKKFVVVCGPCAADDPAAMEEYLVKLKRTSQACSKLLIVARIYTAKPHSNGEGYKGTAFQLSRDDEIDINDGIMRCRRMMAGCLKLGLPVADELLYPELYECFDDLVNYWFVGARSSEDALHRDIASGLDVCCGIKNPTDGDVEKVVNSLYAVASPRIFPYKETQIAASGCKTAHIVLRGGYRNGAYMSNIDGKSVEIAKSMLRERGLNDFIMADLNHANSGKNAFNQITNAEIALKSGVNGIMMESYLYSGARSDKYGVSKTDDCLSFEMTESLLKFLNGQLEK